MVRLDGLNSGTTGREACLVKVMKVMQMFKEDGSGRDCIA